jgi:pyruvate kinase
VAFSADTMPVRRAKIVCTIGPSVASRQRVSELVEAGMDVARLNFSHGTAESHAELARLVREESARSRKPVALLQDLCGPKIRTGSNVPSSVATGESVWLVAGDGGGGAIGVGYARLAEDVVPGDPILLGDGQVELRVEAIENGRVRGRVEHGGDLRSRMGVNLPSGRVKLPALTGKDRRDLELGLDMGADYIALSFVKNANEIETLRALCVERGRPTPIVAKIETPSAVQNIESIVRAADAVMVARGDLGVELPPEQVPVIQRAIIAACRVERKPAIVATEMLQSMVDAPRPTRAEASDVAGAVFGGADAVMLSAETATGAYPIRAVEMMDRIIRSAESSSWFSPGAPAPDGGVAQAIAAGACDLAARIGAKVVVALTTSGGTARLVSKARPAVPIVAFSPEPRTLCRLALFWGVAPSPLQVVSDVEVLVERASKLLVDQGLARRGECFVLVYGAPLGAGGPTNAVRVEQVR